MMIKALLLDLDGTLIDSERIPRMAWQKAAEHFGFTADETFLNQLTGMTKQTAQGLVKKVLPENVDVEAFQAYRHQIMAQGIKAKKGARELLLKAQREDVECIVVTSSYTVSVGEKLAAAGLADLIEKTVCGDEVMHGKPAPDIYLLAMERYHLNKDECIVIEDSKNGLLSAKQAEIKSILVPDLISPDAEMTACAEVVLNDLTAVLKYLFKN